MEQQPALLESLTTDRLDQLSREDLKIYVQGLQDLVGQLVTRNRDLSAAVEASKIETFLLSEEMLRIRSERYGKSSEKLAAPETSTGEDLESPLESKAETDRSGSSRKPRRKRIQLPSERYPNAPLEEREVELGEARNCSCCGEKLVDSGMTEDLEYLEKIPASYRVIREKKHKYNCTACHGEIVTTPAIPRIKPGSAYGDGVIIDVGVSKFCDLIPIERQVKIADRLGFTGLPPQSLIETTHYLADFLRVIYEKIRSETLSSRVLYADETPHRMLEGAEKSNWFFWGFSGNRSAYFEAHDTRSGDVAIDFLKYSNCEYLMSDVYSGYVRTATAVNESRKIAEKEPLKKIYCNAHARRKFKEAKVFPEHLYFLEAYQKIYRLEELSKGHSEDQVLENRFQMIPIFEEMKKRALEQMVSFSSKSSLVKAFQYFLKNFEELTAFTRSDVAPIDNNQQERLLRNPVVGRKTWYGTHSVRGAETTAILFSVMESCKMNSVNPRAYLPVVTKMIHEGKDPPTPSQFALNLAKT